MVVNSWTQVLLFFSSSISPFLYHCTVYITLLQMSSLPSDLLIKNKKPECTEMICFPHCGGRAPFPFPRNTNPQTPAVKPQPRALTFGFGSILHAQMGLHKVQSCEECCKLLSQVKFKKWKGEKKSKTEGNEGKDSRCGSDGIWLCSKVSSRQAVKSQVFRQCFLRAPEGMN